MKILISLLPVLVFLLTLFAFDSFKLVNRKWLLLSLFWGFIVAGLAYMINTFFLEKLEVSYSLLSRYIAPFSEELMKSLLVVWLIRRQKIGFAIDGIIYGFAIGAGFALIENLVFFFSLSDESGISIWLIRGFGTALMHGGASALLANFLLLAVQRDKSLWLSYWPAFLAAYILHSLFNHFLINPFIQTIAIFLILPLVFMVVFQYSNKSLQNWLEIEFSNEVELLRMIRNGKFSDTKAGIYLISIKKHFSPEMIVDLYMYLSLYLDLSIQVKRNMMLKENGFTLPIDPLVGDKLKELSSLRKQIGKVGELTIQPLVRLKYRELWQLNQLHAD
jgi:protease PrsW